MENKYLILMVALYVLPYIYYVSVSHGLGHKAVNHDSRQGLRARHGFHVQCDFRPGDTRYSILRDSLFRGNRAIPDIILFGFGGFRFLLLECFVRV